MIYDEKATGIAAEKLEYVITLTEAIVADMQQLEQFFHRSTSPRCLIHSFYTLAPFPHSRVSTVFLKLDSPYVQRITL